MSNIGEQLAFPGGRFEDFGDEQRLVNYPGMTYRQWLAGMALQGAMASYTGEEMWPADTMAKCCLERADALIAELSKPHGTTI